MTGRGRDAVTRTRLLGELSWPAVAEAVDRGAGVIVPFGAVEQHGPHLPLLTDSMLASDLAIAVAREIDLVVAPTLPYGCRSRPSTGGGQGFVGTTSLSGRTFMVVVAELLQELIRQGFLKIVLLNWHTENQNFMYDAAFEVLNGLEAARAPRLIVMEEAHGELSPATMHLLFEGTFPGWDTEHAAILETSLMLHLHPELVRFDLAVDDEPEERFWYDVFPVDRRRVTPSGSLWHATEATAEKGRIAWSEIVGQVRAAIVTEFEGAPPMGS